VSLLSKLFKKGADGGSAVNYEVTIIPKGRYGFVEYAEGQNVCRFEWEFGGTVTIIMSVPSPQEWDDECSSFAGRRDEILSRVAEECRRQKAPSARIEISDRFIYFR
jgi:hypothetical protein